MQYSSITDFFKIYEVLHYFSFFRKKNYIETVSACNKLFLCLISNINGISHIESSCLFIYTDYIFFIHLEIFNELQIDDKSLIIFSWLQCHIIIDIIFSSNFILTMFSIFWSLLVIILDLTKSLTRRSILLIVKVIIVIRLDCIQLISVVRLILAYL